MWARNEQAVCGPGGAGDVPTREQCEPLRGRDVIIWRDNDAPGLRWATEIQRNLRGIARSTRLIVWAESAKADCVDFFNAGGVLDDLLSSDKPVLERVADDHIRVTVPSAEGPVVFDADEIFSGAKGELTCEMTVSMGVEGIEDEPYALRLNMLSESAKQGLVRALGDHYGNKELGWTRLLATGLGRIVKSVRDPEITERLEYIENRPSRTFLVEEILPEGQTSILFAPPASTKSLTSAFLAVSVALGGSFAGWRVPRSSPVLILDYESNKEDWERRIARALLGLGLDPAIIEDLPIRRIPGGGIPMADQVRRLRRAAEETGAELLIVDSAGWAVSGDMLDPAPAMKFFAALDRVNVPTKLVIGQVPAADDTKLYGNAFWQYAPHGRNWRLSGKPVGDEANITWICTKNSNGPWPQPWGMSVRFNGTDGPIVFNRSGTEDEYAERIQEFLSLNGVTPQGEVAKAIEIPYEQASRILTGGRGVWCQLERTADSRWGWVAL
jgi:hypothetical protein